jgi:hypothetical protein
VANQADPACIVLLEQTKNEPYVGSDFPVDAEDCPGTWEPWPEEPAPLDTAARLEEEENERLAAAAMAGAAGGTLAADELAEGEEPPVEGEEPPAEGEEPPAEEE